MPFKTMKFRHQWRPYQKRVLEAIHNHLNDKKLHIVAAPGAGKTTLGLEVFRMLKKPTIILSPTRVIRDQWIERLKDFCDDKDIYQLAWISNSIQNPKTLTSITYQALHSKLADELNLDEDDGLEDKEIDEFIKTLQNNKIQVIILDEAHHLRSQWWKALEKVTEHLPNLILVSLTATPPYDSIEYEWNRYEKLCGSIDEEISIPELVKAGTLCPHQDFIWACDVSMKENEQIQEYDERVINICNTLFNSSDFENIILAHKWLNTTNNTQEIIKEPYVAISILSFLKEKEILSSTNILMLEIDMQIQEIPKLARKWWQILIETVLFSKNFELNTLQDTYISELKKQLRGLELLHKRNLSIERSKHIERSLSLSKSKIQACSTIHDKEYLNRGDSLRQVILTDYIRDETLSSNFDKYSQNLGAWPIFETIINTSKIPNYIALLSGRLSIISLEKLDILLTYLDTDKYHTEQLPDNPNFIKVSASLNKLTNAFTMMLLNGDIKTLIGTRSLLGEGWDAPVVNSLILASSIGSFMLTNQMRGRAIRVDKNNPSKISSIWHLVAINTKSSTGFSDLESLQRRFKTFVGLSEKDLSIQSGFKRINASYFTLSLINKIDETSINKNNSQMLKRYKNLQTIASRWEKALCVDEEARVLPSIKVKKIPALRNLVLKHSFSYLLIQMTILLSAAISAASRVRVHSFSKFLGVISAALFVTFLYNIKKTIAIAKTLLLYLPVDGSLKQISKALLVSLCETNNIQTPIQKIKLNVVKQPDGSFDIALSGCTFYESSIFTDSLNEILSPIENPRYIISREDKFAFKTRYDYHSVPYRLAIKKRYASIFYKAWVKYVSSSELIYTRSNLGHRALLQAKMKAFSSNFKEEVEKIDRWF